MHVQHDSLRLQTLVFRFAAHARNPQEGMAWVDGDGAGPAMGGGGGRPAYFFPSLWQGERLLDEGVASG